MPIIETNICYEYADKTTKAKAIRKHNDLTWVSTSMQNGVERWKFANVVHEPSPPREPRYYSTPEPVDDYWKQSKGGKKKIPYKGDDTQGNRRAWDK